jgi:transcriptional regulator with XRE-family HTH domain
MMSNSMVEALKTQQQRGGLPQRATSDRLGINQSTLSRLYAGERDLGMETVQRIVQVCLGLAVL